MAVVDLFWLESSRAGASQLEASRRWFRRSESERWERFATMAARRDFTLGRWLARTALARVTGIGAERWSFQIGEHGRPTPLFDRRLPGPDLNLTHGGGVVAVALGHDGRVGVDAESANRPLPARRLDRFLAPEESATFESLPSSAVAERFWRIWTLKEACLKADGRGIAAGLQSVALELGADDRPRIQRWDGGLGQGVECALREFRPKEATCLALACLARDLGELEVRTTHLEDPSDPHGGHRA